MLLTSDEVVQATIRENTERPITVDVGTNYLAGTCPKAILEAARNILSGTDLQTLELPRTDSPAPLIQTPKGCRVY